MLHRLSVPAASPLLRALGARRSAPRRRAQRAVASPQARRMESPVHVRAWEERQRGNVDRPRCSNLRAATRLTSHIPSGGGTCPVAASSLAQPSRNSARHGHSPRAFWVGQVHVSRGGVASARSAPLAARTRPRAHADDVISLRRSAPLAARTRPRAHADDVLSLRRVAFVCRNRRCRGTCT